MDKNTILLMGLPASGKTTFAINECSRGYLNSYRRLDLDKLMQDYKKRRCNQNLTADEILEKIIKDYFSKTYIPYIVDGLFLCNNDVINFLKILKIVFKHKIKDIEIHYWEPNVEACLWNDQFRRDKDSSITIKNAMFEKPDVKLIEQETGITIKIMQHQVIRKPLYQVYCDKNQIILNNDRYLHSDSWCLGGTWGNCWGDRGTISSESSPSSFEEFDNIIEKFCPDISFMRYKKIYNQCVSTGTSSENDYYGGSSNRAYYICDMKELFNQLLELKLISEKDILR